MRDGFDGRATVTSTSRRVVALSAVLALVIVSVSAIVTYGMVARAQTARGASTDAASLDGCGDATVRRSPFPTVTSTFHRDLLDPRMQVAYDQVLSLLLARGEHGCVSVSDPGDASVALEAVLGDHPEIFWSDGGGTIETDPMTGVSDMTPGYSCPEDGMRDAWDRCESAIDGFVRGVPPDASEYERVRLAYEYVVGRMEYAEDAPNPRSVVGCLVDGRGVCVAYARTLQLLLSRLGVWSTYVTGRMPDGAAHAWLLVRIDGRYVHCDPTFGDPSYDVGVGVTDADDDADVGALPDVSYDYMCVSTEAIVDGGRSIDAGLADAIPRTTDAYDWYRMSDAYVDSVDSDVPRRRMGTAMDGGGGVVRLRYASASVFEDAVGRLADGTYFDADVIASMLARGRTGYRYVLSRASRTVWVML